MSEVNTCDPKLPAEPATSSSKKRYEWIWRGAFVAILGLAAWIIKHVYIFQTNEHFENIRLGSLMDFLKYSLPFSVVFTIMDLLIHHYFDPIFEEHYITEQKYTDPASKKKRCYTLVKWAYSIVYYLISSAWAYKIMIGTTLMPSWLGGHGSVYSMIEEVPHVPSATFEMKVFYILQAGKHFSRFFSHVFIRPEGNFFEYALHHGLSCFLILFSYLTNQWTIGVLVLLLHDYSDFALITARMYKDYKHYSKRMLDVIYVHAYISWVGCRNVLFSYCCIYAAFIGVYRIVQEGASALTEYEREVLLPCYWFMVFMMAGLEALHIFWTYYITESFVSVKVSKDVRHTYD